MDAQQLKLLAGRIRGLLEHANVSVTHSQALDLSGALVGLRNWPEVQAFPARVTAADLDMPAAGRLAHRLSRVHGLELSAQEVLQALRPPADSAEGDIPHIWPSGPRPGVYIATAQEQVNALLAAYDEDTDGALVYAERAGSHWKTSIDLGEDGLWSSGMQAVPSGTLVVLGPIDLNQQNWEDASLRLENACLSVHNAGHRVVALVETETPDTLFHDIDLMVRMKGPEGDDTHEVLLGVVNDNGEMVLRSPFVQPLPAPVFHPSPATPDALPSRAVPLLQKALEKRRTGLLILGSSEIDEHRAADLVNAALLLTDFAGPAARIRPRRRGTPSKDWNVPEAMKALPFLPSIQSAYSLGYRRMVIDAVYTDEELVDTYADEVLFIAGTYGGTADDVFMSGVRYRGFDNADKALDILVAVLAVTHLKTHRLDVRIPDMYVPDGRHPAAGKDQFSRLVDMVLEDRCLRAEEDLTDLLDTKQVTSAAVKKALPRTKWVAQFLADRAKRTAVAAR
jgi:hypothetical protein